MVVRYLSDLNTDGTCLGQSSADKVAFYGVTPVVRRSGSDQATSLLASSSTVPANILAVFVEIAATMKALGLWKGTA